MHQAREALRLIERQHETQLGAALSVGGSMMATPGKATLTGALASAPLDALSQLSRMIASAAIDVANLEQANRSGDFNRASWALAGIKRFIKQLPLIEAGLAHGADAALVAQVHEVLTRAEVALENAPTFSQAARDAADRGDRSLWGAELVQWQAKTKATAPASDASNVHDVASPSVHDGTAPNVHDVAAQGMSGSGDALPHADAIERSFGPEFDIRGLRAHIGGAAASAADALGAEAYASGSHIAFSRAPDVHTAAHEAAHAVLQQRGIAPAGGIGNTITAPCSGYNRTTAVAQSNAGAARLLTLSGRRTTPNENRTIRTGRGVISR